MKKLSALLLILLFAGLFASVPYSHATISIIYTRSYSGSNYSYHAIHPSTNGSSSAYGFVFNVTVNTYIVGVDVDLYRYGTPNGELMCSLANYTGTLGTNAVPSTIVENSSTVIHMESLPTSASKVSFVFSGDNLITANTSMALYWWVSADGDHYNPSNYPRIPIMVTDDPDSESGTAFNYVYSSWNVLGADRCMAVIDIYGSDTDMGPTPTPTATAAPADSNATNVLIDTFVDILVPLILFLLPALILGWLTHWEKWPILIGLAIGAGLVYMFLGTTYLWLVVTVIIGIAGMAYSEFRSGGGPN